MADPSKASIVAIETKDIPSVYCNQATISMSLNDVRIFLVEALPQTVQLRIGGPREQSLATQAETIFKSQHSLVMSPEFAKTFVKALHDAVELYEKTFGAIRQEPSVEDFQKILQSRTRP
jgi:Protein of unknown function (DUF3467)